ncbi:hypothetical protein [Agrobacterium sp. V1]|uniref:hypothetical protein n=1 Tax=Agrobacterium sp. V1 TaxID=3061957 RepID=UPI0026734A6B|nr:hypothetical protein [Agrobacterium sp. V1]MDO3441020.1 hypothetical protein [Agrobacterium sp. V1]
MRLMIRTLMFLACLLYGAMPAQMAMSMPVGAGMAVSSQPAMSDDNGHSNHAGNQDINAETHGQDISKAHKSSMGDCCPHGDDATHPGSCAACLIVVPQTIFADAGRMIFDYPKPQRGILFNGKAFAPLLPPPRT